MRRALLLLTLGACTAPTGSIEQAVTQCTTPVQEGVDIYDGTGTIDWAMVKASGRQFAFIKATQGDYNKQTKFAANWSASLAAGVVRSPYHFFDATKDGVAQANFFLAAITAAGGLQPGDLPPMLDIECPTSSSQTATSANCEYTGDSGWVPTAMLNQRIMDFLDTVEAATGTKAILYSYVSWFAGLGVNDAHYADYPLYIASYNACATIPAPWTSAVFWQYSATTKVPGITAAGDVDRFFGTLDDLHNITIQPPAPPVDAGVPDTDAAIGDDAAMDPLTNDKEKAGCGCRSTSTGGALPLGLALVALRRRRRR
jgi:lysozyme